MGAVDRLFHGVRLYKAGKAPRVMLIGGAALEGYVPESKVMTDMAGELGLPQRVLLLEGKSRNTRENAMFTKNVVDSIHCDEALLVTSAAHMPRSMAAFSAVGISVIPVSTDVRVAATGNLTVMHFLPDAEALNMSSDAIREMVGQWVYELRGWN